MGAQYLAAMESRSSFHFRTAIGTAIFAGGFLFLIAAGFFVRNKDKRVKAAVLVAATVIILVSLAADAIFSH